ncbi:MAG: putative transcriptional regulator [Pseudonocardia sp.]|jgi:DNA-binding transcriptional ArsR family regulator|nr:putative transcriptional regulator [Pseudonocardia sp.]
MATSGSGTHPHTVSAVHGSAAGDDIGAVTDVVLRALADPQRRRILRLVRGGELPAGEIARQFAVTQQGVSHHLQVLHRAGLLRERREGTKRLYTLDPQALDPVREVLADLWPSALQRLKHIVEHDQTSAGDHPPS